MSPFRRSVCIPIHCGADFASESAATLEAESGYTMETSDVSKFRQCILDGDWSSAEDIFVRLGLSDEDSLWVQSGPNTLSLSILNCVYRKRNSSSASRNILSCLNRERRPLL